MPFRFYALCLDKWPELYGDSLVISQHLGIGLAPWNILSLAIRSQEGEITVDAGPLVFYHFASFSLVSRFRMITGTTSGMHFRKNAPLLRRYALAMRKTHTMLQDHGVVVSAGCRVKLREVIYPGLFMKAS